MCCGTDEVDHASNCCRPTVTQEIRLALASNLVCVCVCVCGGGGGGGRGEGGYVQLYNVVTSGMFFFLVFQTIIFLRQRLLVAIIIIFSNKQVHKIVSLANYPSCYPHTHGSLPSLSTLLFTYTKII